MKKSLILQIVEGVLMVGAVIFGFAAENQMRIEANEEARKELELKDHSGKEDEAAE